MAMPPKSRSKSHSHSRSQTTHPHKNKKTGLHADVTPGAATNRQNSDLSGEAHPSGSRIEGMYRDVRLGEPDNVEIRRPSERENRYNPPEEPAEGARDEWEDDDIGR